jgi:fatty acid-binding protein DegV
MKANCMSISKKQAQAFHDKTSTQTSDFYATFCADTVAIRMNSIYEAMKYIKEKVVSDEHIDSYEYSCLVDSAKEIIEAAKSLEQSLANLEKHVTKVEAAVV